MKYLLAFLIFVFNNVSAQTKDMMIRISEIEVDSNYLKEYYAILQEESRASVQLESGVIAIYPMDKLQYKHRPDCRNGLHECP